MKIETALRVQEILKDIKDLKAIASQIEKEPNHWWAFKSPGCTRANDGDGLYFPEPLEQEFPKLVDSLIARLESELKEI